jgi:hypothetical protein
LADTRLGAWLLVDWLKRVSWVFVRAEDIVVSVDDWAARSFTVDLEIQGYYEIPKIKYNRFVPLATLQDVREVKAQDENGAHLSTLARVEQQRAVASMLVAAEQALLTWRPTDQTEVAATSEELIGKLRNTFEQREFVCLRTNWVSGDRHVVCVKYRQGNYLPAMRPESPSTGNAWRRLLTRTGTQLRQLEMQLGMRPTIAAIELPDLSGARDWQFDVTVPDGAELQKAQFADGGRKISSATTAGRQLSLTCNSASEAKSLEVNFRISRQWRSWVLINALIITLLLFIGAFRIGFVAGQGGELGTRDLTAAFLLGINGAFAGILARPSEDALTSIFLRGIRIAISILGLLAFIAVGSLAFGPSGDALSLLWLVLAAVSGGVSLLVLGGAGLLDRRRSQKK